MHGRKAALACRRAAELVCRVQQRPCCAVRCCAWEFKCTTAALTQLSWRRGGNGGPVSLRAWSMGAEWVSSFTPESHTRLKLLQLASSCTRARQSCTTRRLIWYPTDSSCSLLPAHISAAHQQGAQPPCRRRRCCTWTTCRSRVERAPSLLREC